MSAKDELRSLLNSKLMTSQNCAKWTPRKGKIAEELRAFLKFSPKRYRKTLVTLTNVVETAMCAKEFETIEFGKVPSVAAARYKKAFNRNAPEQYTAYAEALASGDAKINAGAVFPYDVLNGAFNSYGRTSMSITERQVMLAQWATLENFVGDASILPMVDVSGSMMCHVGGSKTLTCYNVAVSLGLYLAEKNTGAFQDTFMTFTDIPRIENLKGDVLQKMEQMTGAVGYNTNLEAALKEVLRVATNGSVAQSDMPEILLILSDMNFDQCMKADQTALDMIASHYASAGYQMPKIVFWNLNAHDSLPARFNTKGVALISGFSPAIMKSVLGAQNFDPVSIMQAALADPRYELV